MSSIFSSLPHLLLSNLTHSPKASLSYLNYVFDIPRDYDSTSPSSDCQEIFSTALRSYEKQTKRDKNGQIYVGVTIGVRHKREIVQTVDLEKVSEIDGHHDSEAVNGLPAGAEHPWTKQRLKILQLHDVFARATLWRHGGNCKSDSENQRPKSITRMTLVSWLGQPWLGELRTTATLR
ncbi:hypothetical protein H4582DRAFT_2060029 [Lactarius indigo]|nr:hypothetical protein H4582DRAFT_2060029 [Lactarius indigo]